jgi:predicted Zn-dependent protease
MNKPSRWLVFLTALFFLGVASRAEAFRKEREERREISSARIERQTTRLRAVMVPLLRVTDHRLSLEDVRLSIVNDPAINAASAGDGRFFVTSGLLNRANDEQLRGVLAHEIAHEDLGHPARAQIVGVGVSLGVALLEELFPGSSSVTPLAGTLISNTYTRPLELEADRHAVILLERAGYSKKTMIDTLNWLVRSNGDTGGSILSSHPATSERIEALRALR